MKIFVIHRFSDRPLVERTIRQIVREKRIDINYKLLDSSSGEKWQKAASDAIRCSEAVIVFNLESCRKSENASWEIDKAAELNKEIVYIDSDSVSVEEVQKLVDIYEFEKEFSGCFPKEMGEILDLYKMMVETSEQLIQRRQKLNAFFITAIGGLIAIAGLLIKFGAFSSSGGSILILYGFGVTGLLLCNSWRNLIDNYGKLNAAKYKVIIRLESYLPAQIFSAEWTALGKGIRPKKYRSFTSTEKNVPLCFAGLIFVFLILATIWQFLG